MLVHAAPMTRINHGFWSFNPTVYPDFFEGQRFRAADADGRDRHHPRGLSALQASTLSGASTRRPKPPST
jgi:hypothetical protein